MANEAADFIPQDLPLGFQLAGGQAIIEMHAPSPCRAFEKPLGGQAFGSVEHGVLIDRQFSGEFTDAGHAIAAAENAAGTLVVDLLEDLPRYGHAGRFDSDGAGADISDYRYITAFSRRGQDAIGL